MGLERVIFPGKVPLKGQYALWQSPKVSTHFIFSVIISGDPVSYLLEMVVVISLEGTLTQTRMGVDRVS